MIVNSRPVPDDVLARLMNDVYRELRRAEGLWLEWQVGDGPEDQYWNLGIITEELGEVARVLNSAMNQRVHKKNAVSFYDKGALKRELVQTAAMCVRMAANL